MMKNQWLILTPFPIQQDSRARRLCDELNKNGILTTIASCYDNYKSSGRILSRLKKYKKAYQILNKSDFDTIVCVNAEILIIAAFIRLLKLGSYRNVILDVYDHHAYIFNGSMARIFAQIEKYAVSLSDKVIIPIKVRLDQYKPRITPGQLKKIHFISNLGFLPFNCPEGDGTKQPVLKTKNKLNIIYAGTIDVGRGLEILCTMAKKYKDLIDVEIYGKGPLLVNLLENKDFRTIYHGEFNFEMLRDIYKSTDAIFAVYELTVPNHKYCDPNKLREVYEFNRPLITNSGTPLSNIVTSFQIGCVLEKLNEDTIFEATKNICFQKNFFISNIKKSSVNFNNFILENKNELKKLISKNI